MPNECSITCDKSYDFPEVYPEGHCKVAFGQSAWIIVFGAIQLFLIQVPSASQALLPFRTLSRPPALSRLLCCALQLPDFNSLTIVSLAAAVMSLMYSTIAIGGAINVGQQPGVQYNLDGKSTAAGVFGVMNALGIVAFACAPLPLAAVTTFVWRRRP